MCLSIQLVSPHRVLAQGDHVGYQFVIVHNGMGFRCGYVRVPAGHPWHGKYYEEIDVDVHGGLTFAEADVPCGKDDDNAYWVGFDCAHSSDAPDLTLPIEHQLRVFGGTVKTQEYVESECHSLCEQAAQAVAQ